MDQRFQDTEDKETREKAGAVTSKEIMRGSPDVPVVKTPRFPLQVAQTPFLAGELVILQAM